MRSNQYEHEGSFLAGFLLGIGTSVAGYFVFSPDHGEKLRNKLLTEWHEIRPEIEQLLEKETHSIKARFATFLQRVGLGERSDAHRSSRSSKHRDQSEPSSATPARKRRLLAFRRRPTELKQAQKFTGV